MAPPMAPRPPGVPAMSCTASNNSPLTPDGIVPARGLAVIGDLWLSPASSNIYLYIIYLYLYLYIYIHMCVYIYGSS